MKKIIFVFTIAISMLMFQPIHASELTLQWTAEEISFMDKHPIIKIGIDPKDVPFEFIDEKGEYKGITADYLSLISQRTGLQFEVVEGLSWPQAYDKALNKEIDMLPAVGKTADRENHFLFSQPYYYFKRVIVVQDKNTTISEMNDIIGLTVAVQRNSSHHSYLLENANVHLSLYDSVQTALMAVATGKEVAFVGNLAASNYLIRNHGLTNLRMISFEAEKDQSLHFAVGKHMPELIGILNKALNSISDKEKNTISETWVGLEHDVDYGPFLAIVYAIGLLAAVIIMVSLYWIARLKSEVEIRKRTQEDLAKAKHEAEVANTYKSSFMARMSHEIRTPLNAITGMSYLLKKSELTATQLFL